MNEREELVMGLLELADQVEAIRPPASRRAQWEWEPPALTPTELRRVAEMLEETYLREALARIATITLPEDSDDVENRRIADDCRVLADLALSGKPLGDLLNEW